MVKADRHLKLFTASNLDIYKVVEHIGMLSRVVSHLFTGSLAGIGELPALAGGYIRYGMSSIFCTVRFGGSFIFRYYAGTPLKRGAWSIKKGAEASKKGVPAKCTISKVLTKFSFGIR
jgi:hypothetical protein